MEGFQDLYLAHNWNTFILGEYEKEQLSGFLGGAP